MSTAVRFWSGRAIRFQRLCTIGCATLCLLGFSLLHAQPTAAAASANQQKAHALLAATIQALGGRAWLDLRSVRMQTRAAKFFQGDPTGTFESTETSEFPDKERLDIRKQHVIRIFSGDSGWEITYKGKRNASQSELDEYQRVKDHTLSVVLGKWYDNPATVLIDEGPSQVERHPTERIKVINPANDVVMLEIDTESHLPLRLSFSWRDPRFHDKTLETTEFDNYHTVEGIATPFTITESQNGEVIGETHVQKVKYNITLPKDFFDPDVAAAHLK